MTVSSDAGNKLETVTTMSNSSTPSAASAGAPAGDETASTIMVNTKAPTAFPPPKTDKPRPHVCGTCSRSFARLEHLKRHERSHTKEKPFQCPECARCFARRDLLLRHQQKLHQTTTPSSRPRNRRESASGATPGAGRVRKNSVAGPSPAAASSSNAASMRPRANTISHIDNTAIQMMAAATAQASRIPPSHSRHPSLIGLPTHHGLEAYGMASALALRGAPLGLPKLETHGIGGVDFSSALRTAPVMPFGTDFDIDGGLYFGASPGSTVNPNALHYNDSPPSMAMDTLSPFPHGLPDMSTATQTLDEFDWVTGFDHTMSFNNGPTETAVDGSSPSALSTTSQSGISDVMVDGSNHHPATTATSSMWQNSIMPPPQMPNPFSLDISGSVFPDLLNGAPVSPQPSSAKPMAENYFSTSPPSLLSGLNAQNMNQALNFGAGPETPSSMNGSSHHGTLPVSTITDSTRNAILGALSAAPASKLGPRKYSFAASTSPLVNHPSPISNSTPSPSISTSSPDVRPSPDSSDPIDSTTLPATRDLQRYVESYLRYFHPHLPFIHVSTLTFEFPSQRLANGRNSGMGGSGCLLLSVAAIGALFELEHQASMGLFGMAKKMIQLYLDERRKANVRKAESIRRTPVLGPDSQQQEPSMETPVWLVQAMLLNVVYGYNCGDRRSGEIASTHAAALVSLAQGAGLLRPIKLESVGGDTEMMEVDRAGYWNVSDGERRTNEQHAEWLRWKDMEERKRTLYAIFTLSSFLVLAFNHTPVLTSSEILLDLPCEEELFGAEDADAFRTKGGIPAANQNRMTFHEALGQLLRASERGQGHPPPNIPQPFASTANPDARPVGNPKPGSFGCLVLIHALHNYIWETRQRHHNKVWTNEEANKMHRHIEPALQTWHAAWAGGLQHSIQRPKPPGTGPLSSDCIPLLDLAHIRLSVNMSRSKERFWQRDWEGMAEELTKSTVTIQRNGHPPESKMDPTSGSSMSTAGTTHLTTGTPTTQTPSPEFGVSKPVIFGTLQQPPHSQGMETSNSRSSSRLEKQLRKAAFFAAESLHASNELGVPFVNPTGRELPLHAAVCVFDCAQILAEWAAALQDRVGRYLGILGRDSTDYSQVPAIMLLEEEDAKLLGKIDAIVHGVRTEMQTRAAQPTGMANSGGNGRDSALRVDDGVGYASKLLRVTAYMFDKATVWPVTRLMSSALEAHADHMHARAEKSVMATD
ncbi:fungal-specific transcription factor domain-containing protein [Dichotomopilus funicola]|uniref:Fungal-specific transcription factor domain-containing protein n=1 Tax=Dichotomopilus funicola TaxID=1934379 RepID=A0AAN6UY97_9PEZI|nr:fungal-specific transcription factor domain-containing protein [Dichotomopilus funicola]